MKLLFIATLISFAQSLQVIRVKNIPKQQTKPTPLPSPVDFFSTEQWRPIEKDLNSAPVFAVVTPDGLPFQYSSQKTPHFYCDADDALDVLAKIQSKTNVKGFNVVPFPLGEAFELYSNNKATIVPSQKAMIEAGGSTDINPVGQQVPLFGCLDITETTVDGRQRVPLFMSLVDARKAIKKAAKRSSGVELEDLEMTCLSLSGVVEHMTTYPNASGFSFVPPASSREYVSAYYHET
eukprot:CAMPEP_0176069244 /NCGR_PEP_ID=MMETSP0120_2-20121206/34570_1 /TAXON_ID=160619 /ORGANISM="Kryptoperidinium foliaceum, Strain CCMP 1326" /LENGTH=235 /DNA_ID=CAMNT_0017402873 /DNA_START=22 /DNA_END=729 /DNA_ORIENTATION=-